MHKLVRSGTYCSVGQLLPECGPVLSVPVPQPAIPAAHIVCSSVYMVHGGVVIYIDGQQA